MQKASCSDTCLGSCVPGAEGPVPLLRSGRPHPDCSEALQWVMQIPDPCELIAPLGHLVRKDTVWGGRGGWAGRSLSLDDISRGFGSSLPVLKCSASRWLPGTRLGPLRPPCQLHQVSDLLGHFLHFVLPVCNSCLIWAIATCPVILQCLTPVPAVCDSRVLTSVSTNGLCLTETPAKLLLMLSCQFKVLARKPQEDQPCLKVS